MRFTRSLIVAAFVALVVAPTALALRFTDDSYNLPVGTLGQAYTHWFRGDGGCGPALPYQFRILSGSLPPGLSLRKDGLVSGTPTQSGSSSFWIELSDENPPSASWCFPVTSEREFTIKVVGPAPPAPPLTITSSSATPGTVGVAYAFGLTADGGGTQTWSVVAGQLPSGLSLNPASGTLTGTPTAAGTYTFTVRVQDGSRSDSKQLTIAVRNPLVITAPAIPLEEVGVELLQPLRLVATGGTGSVRLEARKRHPARRYAFRRGDGRDQRHAHGSRFVSCEALGNRHREPNRDRLHDANGECRARGQDRTAAGRTRRSTL